MPATSLNIDKDTAIKINLAMLVTLVLSFGTALYAIFDWRASVAKVIDKAESLDETMKGVRSALEGYTAQVVALDKAAAVRQAMLLSLERRVDQMERDMERRKSAQDK